MWRCIGGEEQPAQQGILEAKGHWEKRGVAYFYILSVEMISMFSKTCMVSIKDLHGEKKATAHLSRWVRPYILPLFMLQLSFKMCKTLLQCNCFSAAGSVEYDFEEWTNISSFHFYHRQMSSSNPPKNYFPLRKNSFYAHPDTHTQEILVEKAYLIFVTVADGRRRLLWRFKWKQMWNIAHCGHKFIHLMWRKI